MILSVFSTSFLALIYANQSSRAFRSTLKRWRLYHSSGTIEDESTDDASALFLRDTSTKVQRLYRFLEEEECEGFESLAIGWTRQDGHTLRGLFATDSFDKGEYVFAIPFPSTLLVQDKYLDEDSSIDENDTMKEEIGKAVTFLEKFVSNPFWKPYVDCLPAVDDPSSFDATPDFWTPTALEQFPVPLLRERNIKKSQLVKREAEKSGEFTAQKLQWALWILQSRGFTSLKQTKQGGLRERTVLLPLIDMINHDGSDPNVSIEVIETASYDESFVALQAQRPISNGEQITMRYGTGFETSLELLDKYGFWTKSNPNDARIDWGLIEKEKLYSRRDMSDPSTEVVNEFCDHLERLLKI